MQWYLSKDEAAYYFGVEHNYDSVKNNKECAAVIYSRQFYMYNETYYTRMEIVSLGASGQISSMRDFFKEHRSITLYGYDQYVRGAPGEVWPEYDRSKGKIVGVVHTHGDTEGYSAHRDFSDSGFKDGYDDIRYANSVYNNGYKSVLGRGTSYPIKCFELYLVNAWGELKRYTPGQNQRPADYNKDISKFVPHDKAIYSKYP